MNTTYKINFDETYFGFMKKDLEDVIEMINEMSKWSYKLWSLFFDRSLERKLIQSDLDDIERYIKRITHHYSLYQMTYKQYHDFFQFVSQYHDICQQYQKIK